VAEAKEIEREEVKDEGDEEDGPVVRLGKWKAKALEANTGEDELNKGTTELKAKRVRFEAMGLIEFEVLVSPQYLFDQFSSILTNSLVVQSMHQLQVPATLHH
jgi:hypothetical protein